MYHRAYLVFTLLALAACGGGGGNTTPIAPSTVAPTSSPTPKISASPIAYAIQIKFVSGGTSLRTMARTVGGRVIHSKISHVLDETSVNGQAPIEITVVPTPASELGQDGGTYGVAEVEVSPAPAVSPMIVASATGAPITTMAIANDPGNFNVDSGSSTPVTGSFIAQLTGSVTGSASTPVYQIPQTLVACGDMPVYGTNNQANSFDQISSLTFASGVGNPQSSTSSDFYIDGPNCSTVGTVNATETEATLHFPYGAVLLSSLTTPFSELSASQFSNTFTSITFSQLVADITSPDATPLNELIIQTASGSVVKVAPFETSDIGNQDLVYLNFGYQQDGFSVDGF